MTKADTKTKRPLSLCEYLSEMGGIRLMRGQRQTMGAGDLLAMDAERWHRARPFRKKLLRDDSGLDPDYAGAVAYEGGYFDHRPDINELLDAISTDLASGSVYSAHDHEEILRLAFMPDDSPEFDDEELPEIGERIENVLKRPVPPKERLIPASSVAMEGPYGSAVHLHQIPRQTRLGRYVTPYLAKVLGGSEDTTLFCAKAYLATGTLPAWHRNWTSAVERAWHCDDFLNGPPF
jgi:hypothetical protein